MAAPIDEVRAFLVDPALAASLTPDTESVEVLEDGVCDRVKTTNKGLVTDVVYIVERCYPDEGVVETLIESEDFETYEARYTLSEVEGGTLVVYTVTVGIDMPVPDWTVRLGVERSTAATLEALGAHFD